MKEEIIKSFIDALKDSFDLEIDEEKFTKILEKEYLKILEEEFFKGDEIKHPQLKFILELLEKIDLEDFYEEG
jgi:hypothetical protein